MNHRLTLKLAAGVGTILILGLCAMTFADRTPAKPPSRTTPSWPTRLPTGEAEDLFRRMVSRNQDLLLHHRIRMCGFPDPWIARESEGNGPKVRAFARAYPDLAQRLVMEILHDPESAPIDRGFAVEVVAALPNWTSEALKEHLREMVLVNEDAGYRALILLGERDPELRHLDLYDRQARLGSYEAFVILASSSLESSERVLKRLTTHFRYPEDFVPDMARKALQWQRILSASDGKKTIERMIRITKADREDLAYSWEDFDWAVRVARRLRLPTLQDCLKERARRPCDKPIERDLQDNALALFASEGGELTREELQRLSRTGYVGNPEELLLKIADKELR